MGKDTTSALLPGTLELLILKTLTVGELHGYAIAQRVKTIAARATTSSPLPGA
jgi:DNA-binding PadR family transcriptional regulator